MEEIIKLLNDYAERHNISEGITLSLEDDGSGHIEQFLDADEVFFRFMKPSEFYKRIKE